MDRRMYYKVQGCRLRGALSTLIRHSHVEATGFR